MFPTLIQNQTDAGQPQHAVADTTETMPMDIMQANPTDSIPTSGSPGMSSAELREQYQKSSEHRPVKNGSEQESWTIT